MLNILRLFLFTISIGVCTSAASISLNEFLKYKKSLDLMLDMGYIDELEHYGGLYKKARLIDNLNDRESAILDKTVYNKKTFKEKVAPSNFPSFNTSLIDLKEVYSNLFSSGKCLNDSRGKISKCISDYYRDNDLDRQKAMAWFIEAKNNGYHLDKYLFLDRLFEEDTPTSSGVKVSMINLKDQYKHLESIHPYKKNSYEKFWNWLDEEKAFNKVNIDKEKNTVPLIENVKHAALNKHDIDYNYIKTNIIDTGVCGGFATKDNPESGAWITSCIANHYLVAKGDYKNALLWYLETNKLKPKWNLSKRLREIKNKLGKTDFSKIKHQYNSGGIELKDIRLWAFKDIKSGIGTRVVDKVELKFIDELNKDIASSDAKSELKEKPLYSTKRADFRYVMHDDTKLRDDDGFSDNVIKLLKKGTMVWLKNGGNNSTGLIPVRVDRKTWGYVLKAALSGAKPKEFFSANPTNSEFDNDDSFSGLWGKYGGSVLDSKGNLKQQSNYASNTSVDTKAPNISLSQSDLVAVDSSNFNLSGFVKDDSSVSEVSINGGLIAIDDSGWFDIAMYLGLGKNKFTIKAIDVFGNKASKSITIVRNKAIVKNKDKKLIPPTAQFASNPNSIALIIGLDDYKSMPNAPWAESDASTFYDYAHNVLGIPYERIRLITGQESDGIGIWKSLEQWLPSQVDKNKSNIYVYFAGHGLASADGKEAYLMPYDGDTSMLSRTAIPRKDVIAGLDSLKARSVTMFMDTCYSGSARGGKGALVADSRGLRIVKKDKLYNLPNNFTLFSAAGNDETASSHPSLKHGLFSYWMMRGLGGEADSNNDSKLTNGELHAFIDKNVQKSAISIGRKQHPQLIGDKDKVIASW